MANHKTLFVQKNAKCHYSIRTYRPGYGLLRVYFAGAWVGLAESMRPGGRGSGKRMGMRRQIALKPLVREKYRIEHTSSLEGFPLANFLDKKREREIFCRPGSLENFHTLTPSQKNRCRENILTSAGGQKRGDGKFGKQIP